MAKLPSVQDDLLCEIRECAPGGWNIFTDHADPVRGGGLLWVATSPMVGRVQAFTPEELLGILWDMERQGGPPEDDW